LKIPIILILAVLWAAFFAWPLVQRRLSGSRRDPIGDFSKRVTSIGHVGGSTPRPLRSAAPRGAVGFSATPSLRSAGLPMSPVAQRRRRDALAILGATVLGLLLLAVVSGSTLIWTVQIAADLLFVAYLATLVAMRKRTEQQRTQVQRLPQPDAPSSPALVLHRAGSPS
jgi:hypothetical protein